MMWPSPGPGHSSYSSGSLADGDPVSSWPDSSGNGNTASQTGSARPIFKTNIINGKPVVRFTSAGLSGLNLATPISSLSPWYVFCVAKAPAAGLFLVPLAASAGVVTARSSDGNLYAFGRSGYTATSTGGPFAGVFHVFMFARGAGGGALQLDGTTLPTADSANSSTSDFNSIGWYPSVPWYSDGDIPEILTYNRALDTSIEVPNLTKFLGNKYGITVAGTGTPVDPSSVPNLSGWWKADSLG